MRLPPNAVGLMRRALALARRGQGAAPPNPMVGCIIVSNGRIVGEGWHRRYGAPHAEAEALRQAGALAKGGTAYVTLEPCAAHPGKKTPPCAPALAKAGIAQVIAAVKDPSGGGLDFLRDEGVETHTGLLAKEAKALNKDFFSRMTARPRVILKTALSLDGRTKTPTGKSQWITNQEARELAHELRADCDAILVGSGTVLADNPSLTSHGAGKNPLRVILDTELRTPRKAKCLGKDAPTVIFTASNKKLPGVETIRVPRAWDGVDLREVLKVLSRRGVKSVLLEGGATVHASFLAAGLVDEARVFISPKLLSGADDPNAAPKVLSPKVRKVGRDYLVSGKVG